MSTHATLRAVVFALVAALWALVSPGASRAQEASRVSWRVESVSPLVKMTQNNPGDLEYVPVSPIQMHAVRGEWESFQIVVTAGREALHDVSVAPSTLATHLGEFIMASNVKLFWENYVLIDHPSGNWNLEKKWWPDALIPIELQPKKEVAPYESVVLWGAVQIPRDAAPGEYYGALEITANGQQKRYLMGLQVANQTMPPPSMRANVAVYYSTLRDWYQKNIGPQNDANWAAQQKRYYDFLLDYRLNAYDLPVAWNSAEADAYLRDSRVLSVRIPGLDQPDLPLAVQKLKANNAIQKAYYYYLDEPSPEKFADVIATTKRLHEIDADLKHCVTIAPDKTLENSVDIWCPNIGDFFGLGHLDLKALEAQRKRGRETWWYTMVEPKSPYPTWLVDDGASSVRIYGALMARYGISGFVYSMAHGWGPKPLENIRSFANTNGDGTLVYPSETVGGIGPMPSIRLMLLRDAIEDYELLQTLAPDWKAWALQGLSDVPILSIRTDDERMWEKDGYKKALLRALEAQKEGRRAPRVKPVALPKPQSLWFGGVANTSQSPKSKLRQTFPIEPKGDGAIPFVHQAPVVDGSARDAIWNARSHLDSTFFARPNGGVQPGQDLWITHDAESLYVAMRCHTSTHAAASKEWAAIEIAPLNASERWRLVVSQSGETSVEHHTRDGNFSVEGLAWKGAATSDADFYDVEMKIPLELVGFATRFRLNALRRTSDEGSGARVTLRAHADAGDVTLMPIVTLGNDGLKSKAQANKTTDKKASTNKRNP